jgi:hypothetical protein
MSDPILLTGVKREAEKIVGATIAVPYRKLYEMALNGDIPAEQINGRWHVERSNIRAVANALLARRSVA